MKECVRFVSVRSEGWGRVWTCALHAPQTLHFHSTFANMMCMWMEIGFDPNWDCCSKFISFPMWNGCMSAARVWGRSLCVSHVWTLAVGSSDYSERSYIHNDGYHSVFLFLGFLAFQTTILMLPILVVMDDTSCWEGHGASLSFAISSPHWRTTSPPPHRMDMRLPIEMTGPQPSPREMKKASWTRRFKKNQNEPLVTHSNQTVDNYYSILKAPLGCLVFSTLIIYLCKRLDCSAWYIYL